MSVAEPIALAGAIRQGLNPGKLFIDGRAEVASSGFDTAAPSRDDKQSDFRRDPGVCALDHYTNVNSTWVAL